MTSNSLGSRQIENRHHLLPFVSGQASLAICPKKVGERSGDGVIRISATAASFKPAMMLAFVSPTVIAAITAHNSAEVLQDVFYELVEAYRLMKPVEQIGAWLFRVPEIGSRTYQNSARIRVGRLRCMTAQRLLDLVSKARQHFWPRLINGSHLGRTGVPHVPPASLLGELGKKEPVIQPAPVCRSARSS